MQEFKKDHLAKEANRLRADDVLNYSLQRMRSAYTEMLVDTAPDDVYNICRYQSQVRVVDDLHDTLEEFILADT
jgi:hypothetical protein